jgi:hypothetical protein
MAWLIMAPIVAGLVGGIIAAIWMSRQQRGTVTKDELSERLTLGSSATAFPVLMTVIVVLWIRDLVRAAGAAAGWSTLAPFLTTIRTSPYTLLLVGGCGIWILSLAIQQWRTGVLDFGSGSAWWYVLSFGLLAVGFLPFRWAAPAQFVGAAIGLVVGVILVRRQRTSN